MLLWERTPCQPLQLSTKGSSSLLHNSPEQPRYDSRAEPMSRKPALMSNLQRAYRVAPSVRGCGTSAIIPFLTAISLRAFDAADSPID